ncbi:hypothetical protein [Leptospira noguchii]|uniref:Uncharacterized protein n=1 Tax=Leptospira noguchii TaxID=28182 RepID=A0AAE9K9L7_9LEPT|nr:hypothetical protein [Leptospira noguchii]UOG57628.1 hypothetical protein MAL03_05705 [Leptospira noguchii]
MHRSLRVALQGRVNSAKRFPELNASLPKGRVNSAKRSPELNASLPKGRSAGSR